MEVCEEFGAFVQSTGNFSNPLAMDDQGILILLLGGASMGIAFISRL
jgi:hypothetical protein